MNLNAVPIGKNAPHDVNVVIEVPIGGEPIKYEMDKESGALVVDRFLYTSMRYPGNYGFIPHTLSDDGDPCDVIVANTRAIVPGAVMSCKIVGVLLMEDEHGGDEKLIAVPSAKLTQRYANIEQLFRPAVDHDRSRSSISSPITRISSPTNGSRSSAGATPTRRAGSSWKASNAPRRRRADHEPKGLGRRSTETSAPLPFAPPASAV